MSLITLPRLFLAPLDTWLAPLSISPNTWAMDITCARPLVTFTMLSIMLTTSTSYSLACRTKQPPEMLLVMTDLVLTKAFITY